MELHGPYGPWKRTTALHEEFCDSNSREGAEMLTKKQSSTCADVNSKRKGGVGNLSLVQTKICLRSEQGATWYLRRKGKSMIP